MNIVITLAMLIAIIITGSVTIPVNLPRVSTRLFSQQVTFTHTQFSYSSTCGSGSVLQQLTFGLWNFTENLSGRDSGSTWMTLKAVVPLGPLVYIFNRVDVSQATTAPFPFYDSFACGGWPGSDQAYAKVWNKTLVVMEGRYLNWRVPDSANYTLLVLFPQPLPIALAMSETWTTTTIS